MCTYFVHNFPWNVFSLFHSIFLLWFLSVCHIPSSPRGNLLVICYTKHMSPTWMHTRAWIQSAFHIWTFVHHFLMWCMCTVCSPVTDLKCLLSSAVLSYYLVALNPLYKLSLAVSPPVRLLSWSYPIWAVSYSFSVFQALLSHSPFFFFLSIYFSFPLLFSLTLSVEKYNEQH